MSHCRGKFLTASQDSAQAPVCKSICAKNLWKSAFQAMTAHIKKTSAKPKFELVANASPPGQRPKRPADNNTQMKVPPPAEDTTGHANVNRAKAKFTTTTPLEKESKKPRLNPASVVVADVVPVPVSAAVRKMFPSTARSLIGIDIETHMLIESNCDFHDGDFGFQRKVGVNIIKSMRTVQVAWAYGDSFLSAPHTIKSRLVRPEGFVIDLGAKGKHGISHEHALEHGMSLADVVLEMFTDIELEYKRGGRICSHHLEFDAGILTAEMLRLGFVDMAGKWKDMVRKGVCTMDPDVTHWVRKCSGDDTKSKYSPMGLDKAIEVLVPAKYYLLNGHHDASVDCQLHWVLAQELSRLVNM
jgi:hypothetical protein